MILTNTTEYALRILSFMVKDPTRQYSAKFLIEELKISDKYLRRIMTDLSKAGFIRSIQGRDGGYVFNKNLDEIYLKDIINVTEGLNKHFACVLGFEQCSDKNPCALHETFKHLKNEYLKIFANKNLSNIDFSNINRN
ncbi:MAG: Rrf2 family transcriptional regulator [Paludibacter sp.]|nr:Rrf2 family transcriptional regulator [Paludibacter sp.]